MLIKDEKMKKWLAKKKNKGCNFCGSLKNLTIDHKHPKVLGGKDDKKNFQILCEGCNVYKGRIPNKHLIKIIMFWEVELRNKGKLSEHVFKQISKLK